MTRPPGLAGFAGTAWPFLAGLAAGWGLWRVWRRPEALLPAGVGVWVTTVAVGMALRAVSGQGTAAAFVIVASVFLGRHWSGGGSSGRSRYGVARPPNDRPVRSVIATVDGNAPPW